MSLTATQQKALASRGNVLLAAGAGTGKTRTLVERCLHYLLQETPRASITELLLVTFTDAAAAEMRQRIRERLEEELQVSPDDSHLQEQLARFETAHIGTLHSFCLELVRQHFYLLEVDPQISVMTEEESNLLAEEHLDRVLQECYSGRNQLASAVQRLIQDQGKGSDQSIRALVRRIHRYSQTVPHPEAWLNTHVNHFSASEPSAWLSWLLRGVVAWRDSWVPALGILAGHNTVARDCLQAIEKVSPDTTRAEAAAALADVIAAFENCPYGQKGDWVEPIEEFQKDSEFLWSLAVVGATDPLTEDWGWVRTQMITLIELARRFAQVFSEAKSEQGVMDFHDLEQFALRLLWDPVTDQPSEIAEAWRNTFRCVFVDEYQDINAAQDKIIQALSRPSPQLANRFLVGDVKQSIYRFRLANPRIFQGYAQAWKGKDGTVIPLVENFRSREGLLKVINSIFSVIMQESVGGVAYDEGARLQFGDASNRKHLSVAGHSTSRVELHLRLKTGKTRSDLDDETAQALAEVSNLDEADKEARLVALRLRELKCSKHVIWDGTLFRAVEWDDMAVLLRSPSAKAESYAKEFAKIGVPLEVARCGFYRSQEISDLLSLLRMLDNPLQDLPVLAVLRSPLVGLTVDELAMIRLSRKGRFWSALVAWHEEANNAPPNGEQAALFQRVSRFLDRFARWRRIARQGSLSRCLETVLAETHYPAWLLTQRGGEQRHANVQRLMTQAQTFDRFQRQGLFRFLCLVEAQENAEADPGVPASGGKNCVRLMSIHQSKGLEFPVVVVADLGKPFNLSDLRGEMILDEEFGLCPQVKPPHTGKRYPSLAFWLARQRQLRESLGEELRLLYVAMTRACDTLILSATVTEQRFAKMWKQNEPVTPLTLASARTYADWLGLWFAAKTNSRDDDPSERPQALMKWFFLSDKDLTQKAPDSADLATKPPFYDSDPEAWRQVQKRIAWRYPNPQATTEPAKVSVTALRKRYADPLAENFVLTFGEGATPPAIRTPAARTSRSPRPGVGAARFGNAHHYFLQSVSLPNTGAMDGLRAEARRLVAEGQLSSEEAEALDFEAISAFLSCDLGRQISAKAKNVRRELAFTARFSGQELVTVLGDRAPSDLDKDFIVVQGAADLVVILPEEMWIVDFKTDSISSGELTAKSAMYQPQLQLYAAALARIYRRPVSKAYLYFLGKRTLIPVQTINPPLASTVCS